MPRSHGGRDARGPSEELEWFKVSSLLKGSRTVMKTGLMRDRLNEISLAKGCERLPKGLQCLSDVVSLAAYSL